MLRRWAASSSAIPISRSAKPGCISSYFFRISGGGTGPLCVSTAIWVLTRIDSGTVPATLAADLRIAEGLLEGSPSGWLFFSVFANHVLRIKRLHRRIDSPSDTIPIGCKALSVGRLRAMAARSKGDGNRIHLQRTANTTDEIRVCVAHHLGNHIANGAKMSSPASCFTPSTIAISSGVRL